MNKKFLAKLLIFCMIFTMLPMTAFGATTTGKVDDTTYTVTYDVSGALTVGDSTKTAAINVANVTYANGQDAGNDTFTSAKFVNVTGTPDYVNVAEDGTITVKGTPNITEAATVTLTGTVEVTWTSKNTTTLDNVALGSVTVNPATTEPSVAVTGVTITAEGAQDGVLTMYKDATSELKAVVAPAEADQTVTWSSDSQAVAVDTQTGKITALNVTTNDAVITATAGKKADGTNATATIKVKVIALPLESETDSADISGTIDWNVTLPDDENAPVRVYATSPDATPSLIIDKTGTDTVAIPAETVKNLKAGVDAEKIAAVVLDTKNASFELNSKMLTAIGDNKIDLKVEDNTTDAKAKVASVVKALNVTFTMGDDQKPVMENASAGLTAKLSFGFTDSEYMSKWTKPIFHYFDENLTRGKRVAQSGYENGKAWFVAEHFSTVALLDEMTEAVVTYDANNGTGETKAETVELTDNKATVKVAENTFTYANHSFVEWNTATDGTGTKYTANTNMEVTGDITLYAQWQENGGSPTGGGSSSNVSIATKVTGGTVTVSPSRPTRGQTVTLNIKPAEGYKLDTLTVTDLKGNTIELTKVSDNKYTFVMPAGKVKVTPTFVKIDGSDKKDDETNVNKRFSDVAADAWYAEYINYVAENGLMNGYEDGRFGPNDKTTRAQIVTVLYRLEGEPAVQNANNFSDVSAGGQYYSAPVAWAARNNIVNGYEDGRFGPNDNVTREQIATILYRYAAYKEYDTTLTSSIANFSDAARVSSWAQNAISWAVAEGLMNGDNGALKPQGNATRAEIATLLTRFSENIAK